MYVTRSKSFDLTVLDQNRAPVAHDDSATADEDTPVDVDVLANDTDAEGDALSISRITQGPANGSASVVNGKIRYVPDTGYSGQDNLKYRAKDAKDESNEATVLLQVNARPPAYQPDGIIHPGPSYIGDGIYNTTGAGQTATRTVRARTQAVYYIKLQNDGELDEKLTLKGTAGSSSWAVQYFDYTTAGKPEITSQVTSASGWTTPAAVIVGKYHLVEVHVTPGAGVSGSFAVTGTLLSTTDPAKTDVVKAQTDCVWCFQPDGHIYPGPGYIGGSVYNTTGAGQTAIRDVTCGKCAVLCAKLQNDGDAAEKLMLKGNPGNSNWAVRYYDYTGGGAEITSQVTGASGWTTPVAIAVGKYRIVEIRVTPAAGTAGNSFTVIGTLLSSTDPGKTDVVKAVTNCIWLRKPDGQVYPGPGYIGNNIYNTTGAGQTATRVVTSGKRAVFYIKLQNDGDAPEKLVLRGGAGNTSWAVKYYDYTTAGKPEITTQVTSAAGWTTPVAVAIARYHIVEVHLTPAAGMGGKSLTLTETLASSSDASKVDVVKLSTNCSWGYKPDGHVYPGPGYIGNHIYNTTGAGQTANQTVGGGVTAVFYIKMQNDGDIAEKLRLKGTAGTSDWAVRYFDYNGSGKPEITAQVLGASGWTTSATVAIARYRVIEVHVTPGSGVSGTFTVTATVLSDTAPSKTDVVKCVTTALAEAHQAAVTVQDETGLQSAALQSAASGLVVLSASMDPASYLVRIQNGGTSADRFLVTGDDCLGAVYEDELGRDITQAIASEGWLTPTLAPGESVTLRVIVLPGNSTKVGVEVWAHPTGTDTGRF